MPNLTLEELVEEIQKRYSVAHELTQKTRENWEHGYASGISDILDWIKERQGTDAGK